MSIFRFYPFLLILLVQMAHADPRESCFETATNNVKKDGKTLDAKVSQGYFNDVHVDSVSSCFELKQGQVYQVTNKHVAQGLKMVEIRDPSSDLYQWIIADRLDRIDSKQATVKSDYFKDIHATSSKSCFELTPAKTYQITDAHWAQRIFMVKIRDSASDLYQWLPSFRLNFADQKLASKCTIAAAAGPNGNGTRGAASANGVR